MANTLPPVPPLTSLGFNDPVWARWLNSLRAQLIQTVLTISINSSNGFTGSVASDAQGQAVITLGVSVSGILKGSGGGIVAAVPGTDYVQSIAGDAPVTVNVVSGVPHVGMPQATGSVDGWLSSTDWTTFNNKLSVAPTITLTGDVTGSGTPTIPTTLAVSGVTAGTYGSGTVVPQITIDAKGRVTSATNVAVTPAAPGYGTTAARPTNPALGFNYFDTTLGQPIWVQSLGPVVWVNSAGVVV